MKRTIELPDEAMHPVAWTINEFKKLGMKLQPNQEANMSISWQNYLDSIKKIEAETKGKQMKDEQLEFPFMEDNFTTGEDKKEDLISGYELIEPQKNTDKAETIEEDDNTANGYFNSGYDDDADPKSK